MLSQEKPIINELIGKDLQNGAMLHGGYKGMIDLMS